LVKVYVTFFYSIMQAVQIDDSMAKRCHDSFPPLPKIVRFLGLGVL
jgi:hypothetical protein